MTPRQGYRDPVYIIKDIILTLVEYGQLNQTSLISFCGLNLTKHRDLLDGLEKNQMITKYEDKQGKRKVTMYKVTPKGIDFCQTILDPYENIFPRKEKVTKEKKLSLLIFA